jgi:hypothetical protein
MICQWTSTATMPDGAQPGYMAIPLITRLNLDTLDMDCRVMGWADQAHHDSGAPAMYDQIVTISVSSLITGGSLAAGVVSLVRAKTGF